MYLLSGSEPLSLAISSAVRVTVILNTNKKRVSSKVRNGHATNITVVVDECVNSLNK
jgi:hypothetical protein